MLLQYYFILSANHQSKFITLFTCYITFQTKKLPSYALFF